jgi:hypothetical protein
MTKRGRDQQHGLRQQHPRLTIDAASEHDEAAGRRTCHEQRDQTKRNGRAQPILSGEADTQPRRIAAHEGHEQPAEMDKADAVDITGERAQRAGQRNVAASIKHREGRLKRMDDE